MARSPETGDPMPAGPEGLATPASAHPVLDVAIQSFLDHAAEAGAGAGTRLGGDEIRARLAALQTGSAERPAPVCHTLTGGPAAGACLHVFRPPGFEAQNPFLLYFHGGGWVGGDARTHGRLAADLADAAGIAVVLVEGVHAPAHSAPAQTARAYAVLCALVAEAGALGLDAARFAIGGDGTGATTATLVALMAGARQGPRSRLQFLLCPVIAPPCETGSYAAFGQGPWVTADTMRALFTLAFPGGVPARMESLPCFAGADDLAELPPALILTAEADVLRDEAEAYGRRLMQAGVQVTLTRYLGAIHGFMVLDPLADSAPARSALQQVGSALRAALHP
ncbi:esterase [Azorhizobium oxalatiphilum]|uniref:Esterase n=1 Tax=Azorhizobium oxalatiphilum TaxID=980631 RepID=A0A917FFU9_9HYPH|nr:alpha/beta hydrolase [Azorhizobium oxalatiphilum]GGF77574.1 esterase [Azorhizobium oxalatiphilum]